MFSGNENNVVTEVGKRFRNGANCGLHSELKNVMEMVRVGKVVASKIIVAL